MCWCLSIIELKNARRNIEIQYCVFQKVQGTALSSLKLGDFLRNGYNLPRYWNLNPSTIANSKLQSSVIVIGDMQMREVYHVSREAEIDIIRSSW